jgi:hypothetical protein
MIANFEVQVRELPLNIINRHAYFFSSKIRSNRLGMDKKNGEMLTMN